MKEIYVDLDLDVQADLPLYVAFLGILVSHSYEPLLDSLHGTKMETADK